MTGAAETLATVVSAKEGGERRPGQEAMCRAVETALAGDSHLLVEAPTGVGKSLAYLVPAVLHAKRRADGRVVVVTATKALQEQLIREDLPFLAGSLPGLRFDFAMLKGRSNYLCRAKLDVTVTEGVEGRFDFGESDGQRITPQAANERVRELEEWAERTSTGDRADAPGMVTDGLWSQVSVDVGECPGAAKCHAGEVCFAEAARARAGEVEVVVVNAHLYAAHLASGGFVLPEHDAVIFDEAHTLEDVMAVAFGVRLTPYRVRRAGNRARSAGGDERLSERLDRAANALEETLMALAEAQATDDAQRVDPTVGDLAATLTTIGALATDALGSLKRADAADDAAKVKALQASRLVEGLVDDVAHLLDAPAYDNQVAWVELNRRRPELHLATVDVGPVLAAALYPNVTVIATSATLATAGRFDILARRLGLTLPPPPSDDDEDEDDHGADTEPKVPPHESLVVESPFNHAAQGWLYVARHLPEPNSDGFTAAMHDELHALIVAAGGRTLSLFTSRAAMERAAEAMEQRGGFEVLLQDRLPRNEMLARFRAGAGSAIFASQSFWQGVDLPGELCHLVTIDRIPFPRPTDPLVQARRQAATRRRQSDFAAVDLPAAATLLAQGAGRLIRTTTDRGVVAVFDRRLATKPYRQVLLATMPPLKRTIDQSHVLATLAAYR